MPSSRDTILADLHARLQTLAAPVLRGDVLPERVPATGLINLLVPQVKLPKQLDLARDAERAQDAVPGLIVARWVEARIRWLSGFPAFAEECSERVCAPCPRYDAEPRKVR